MTDKLQGGVDINEALAKSLFAFARVWGKLMHTMQDNSEFRVPKVSFGILITLREEGPMPISRIGERMYIAKSNMTSFIDDLAEKGWVKRCASEVDRRVVNIHITDKGLEAIEAIISKRNEILNRRFSVLSEEEKQEAIESLIALTGISQKVLQPKKREAD